MKGVLDRIEDRNMAVILIEELNKELAIPMNELPAGSKEGTWFHVKKKNNTLEVDSIDGETTKLEANKSSDLMRKLRNKRRESKFKKK